MLNKTSRSLDLDVLIMAAGLGTRMRSGLAKVLHELDSRPLINHVCAAALELSPRCVYIVVGHQSEAVKAAVMREFDGSPITFVEQTQQLGTGDAVNAARAHLQDSDSTLLVLSGDVPLITPATLSELVSEHQSSGSCSATALTISLDDPTGYGRVIRDAKGKFQGIIEQKDATDEQRAIKEVNAGVYAFNARHLFTALSRLSSDNAQGEFYLTDVPQILKEEGHDVGIFKCTKLHEVEGVNDRRQLAAMENEIRKLTVEKLMLESGVTFIDPTSVYISAATRIGRDTIIHANVTIEGITVIGEGCVVRSGTRISNSTIADKVEIRDNCLIMDSEIATHCTVGPMAHLRGNAMMAEGAKVGNFVELKKTLLGPGSKASHLTYLGDALIGENTNIGAGTVTCNYDGKNKHETVIGSGVKIGSDTMLVAPVKVGDGAATGAGSVVTKDVEPNTLVAGVPARPIKKLSESDNEGTREQAAR